MYELETEGTITDIDDLDNDHLVVCKEKGVCVYTEQRLVSDHDLGVQCKPSDGRSSLTGVSVCKKIGQVVVSEYRAWGRRGCLHVYSPDGDTWQYDRYQVCQEPDCVSVTSSDHYSVADYLYSLHTYNSGRRQLCSVKWLCRGFLHDLSVSDDDVTFLCGQNKLAVYDSNGQHVSTTDRHLQPYGVVVNKKGTNLCV